MKQRLFVDMDGTLAFFKPVNKLETLYEEGYFLNLNPQVNVLEAIRDIAINNTEVDVYILSAYLTDSKYALSEKNQWLDRFIPEITAAKRIFIPCGENKTLFINGGIRETDVLLDDYTNNLNNWQPPAKGIKLLNDINNTHGTWKYDRVKYDHNPYDIAKNIIEIMKKEEKLFEKNVKEKLEQLEKKREKKYTKDIENEKPEQKEPETDYIKVKNILSL